MSNKFTDITKISKNYAKELYTSFNKVVALNRVNLDKLSAEMFTNIDFEQIITGQKPAEYIINILAFPFEFDIDNINFLTIGWAGGAIDDEDGIVCSDIDCTKQNFIMGEYYVEPKYNDFRDYNGYHRIQVYLPYYGFIDVEPNECVGKWLQFRLSVDVSNGIGTYFIGVTPSSTLQYSTEYPDVTEYRIWGEYLSKTDKDMVIIKSVSCEIGYTIPLGSSNQNDVVRNVLSSGLNIALNAVNNAFPPVTKSVTKETKINSPHMKTEYIKERRKGGAGGGYTMQTVGEHETHYSEKTTDRAKVTTSTTSRGKEARFASLTIDGANSVLNSFGSFSASTSGVETATLAWQLTKEIAVVRYYPNYVVLDESEKLRYAHFLGRPFGRSLRLNNSSLGGFTICSTVYLTGDGFSTATLNELNEIEEILTDGFILPVYGE